VVDNTFTFRFPDSQLIDEWSCFNPISMRSIKAKINITVWDGSVGAKGELQMGWFGVRGVPYDKRSIPTMAYVGSLVGATAEVDKSTLGRTDYVRIKIAARDISKVPERAEGAIIPYLYDFLYEREVEMGTNVDGDKISVQEEKGNEDQTLSKDSAQVGCSGQPGLQMDKLSKSHEWNDKGNCQGDRGSKSAPSKMNVGTLNDLTPGKKGGSRFNMKADEHEFLMLGSPDNRVQGLSGNDIGESEEDLLSDEVQGSQPNPKNQLVMVKHVQPSIHKQVLLAQVNWEGVDDSRENVDKELEFDPTLSDGLGVTSKNVDLESSSKNVNVVMEQKDTVVGGIMDSDMLEGNQIVTRHGVDPLPVEQPQKGVVLTSDAKLVEHGGEEKHIIQHQQILATGFSSRIQEQIIAKGGASGRSPSKKRSLQGTSLNSQNFFAILDNLDISDIAAGMGINASKEHFETFDLMKDIEIARHALDNVRQIYMFGGFFTWSNNQANPTLERLDSILVSKEWEGMYPTVLVFKKPMEFSNHNPVILDSGSAQACKSREFRFELSWLRQEGFLPKIKEIWLAPTRDRLALNRVMFKLKKVKIFLKGWEYNLAGSRKKRKQNIERMIMVIEEKEESGSIPIELLKRGIDLKVELIKILEEEELHWLKKEP
jgi:hypothetical protein